MGTAPLFFLLILSTGSMVAGHMRGRPRSKKSVMDCGEKVLVCGVLSLDTGIGHGLYHHEDPSVHGLWPETGRFGDSRCRKPSRSNVPAKKIFPCYKRSKFAQAQLASSLPEGIKPRKVLSFQTHEWVRHGKCAGVKDAKDYFLQVCDLADLPLALLKEGKRSGGEFADLVGTLKAGGFDVWDTDPQEGEIRLSACATSEGHWKLAAQPDFDLVCGPGKSSKAATQSSESEDIGTEAKSTAVAADSDDIADDEQHREYVRNHSLNRDSDDDIDAEAVTQSHPVAAKSSAAADESDELGGLEYMRHHSLDRDSIDDMDTEASTQSHPAAGKSSAAADESDESGTASTTQQERIYRRNHSLRRSLVDAEDVDAGL